MSEPLAGTVDERGIPTKSDYPPKPPVPVLYVGFAVVGFAIGFGIAFAVYVFGAQAKYDRQIDALAAGGLGWIYLSVVAIKVVALCININLGLSRKAAKVNVPDQQVYKVYVPESQSQLGYVMMETEGVLGTFNRAQRAYQNFLEQLPIFLVVMLLAGYAFAFPAFICALIYGSFRVIAAVGYTKRPKGRMAGNILGMISQEVLQGFLLIAGIKAILREV
mmetsp:Transcript_105207/g.327998  ORF Transcript_105207/g.327998 Transcript_105207/m.327998 type:complete len:220 (+) Transcript_105207:59-718(+)